LEHRARLGKAQAFRVETEHLIMGVDPMESQVFSPKAYSLPEEVLIPEADDCDEPDVDVRWLRYCEVAASLDREAIIDVVLDELRESSALLDMVEDACHNPHEPGRPKTSLSDLLALGKAALLLIARAVDDQVSLRMAVEVRHD
jgi:hypothetical protein